MREETFKIGGMLLALLISLLIIFLVWQNFTRLQDKNQQAGLDTARAAVEMAVSQCYALEGAYPPDLTYLKTHYGLLLDEENYAIYYEVIADNIYPVVDVHSAEDVWQ